MGNEHKFKKFCKFLGFNDDEMKKFKLYIQHICDQLQSLIADIELIKGNSSMEMKIWLCIPQEFKECNNGVFLRINKGNLAKYHGYDYIIKDLDLCVRGQDNTLNIFTDLDNFIESPDLKEIFMHGHNY